MTNTILCGSLSNGVLIPAIGFGTFELPNTKSTQDVISTALQLGYRHVDTALAYNNHEVVGSAIKEFDDKTRQPQKEVKPFGPWKSVGEEEFIQNMNSVPKAAAQGKKQSIFITSKVFTFDFTPEKIHAAVDRMTSELQRPVDLILLHWPAAHSAWGSTEQEMKDEAKNTACRLACWKAFEEAYHAGKVRAIGVSNYNEHHLIGLLRDIKERKARGDARATIPMINQFEISPMLSPRRALLDIMKNNGILATGYCTLGSKDQTVMKNTKVLEIAASLKRTPSQVIIRWCLQNGYLCIPRTSKKAHAEQNYDFDFELTPDMMDEINSLHTGNRRAPNPDEFA